MQAETNLYTMWLNRPLQSTSTHMNTGNYHFEYLLYLLQDTQIKQARKKNILFSTVGRNAHIGTNFFTTQ